MTAAAGGSQHSQHSQLLAIGEIVKPHGLSGEVVVRLDTNVPGRLAPGSRLVGRRLPNRGGANADAPDGGSAGTGADVDLEVLQARTFQQRYLVSFLGVADRSAAEALRGVELFAAELDDDEAYFVHKLIGSMVVERSGRSRGRVAAVEANPASDLLVGEEGWLVPLRFVVRKEPGRLTVEVPDGLFDNVSKGPFENSANGLVE